MGWERIGFYAPEDSNRKDFMRSRYLCAQGSSDGRCGLLEVIFLLIFFFLFFDESFPLYPRPNYPPKEQFLFVILVDCVKEKDTASGSEANVKVP